MPRVPDTEHHRRRAAFRGLADAGNVPVSARSVLGVDVEDVRRRFVDGLQHVLFRAGHVDPFRGKGLTVGDALFQ